MGESKSAGHLRARRVTSLAIRLRAASGDVQTVQMYKLYGCTNCTDVQIQLCTSVQFIGDNNFDVKVDSAFATGFYTREEDKSAGRQSAQLT